MHVSRSATYDVEFLWAIPTLLALNVILYEYSDRILAVLTWLAGMLLLLCMPGMVWLIIINLVLQRNELAEAWETLETWWLKSGAIVAVIGIVGGLAALFYRRPDLLLPWAGLPAQLDDWLNVLKRFIDAFAYFIVRGPHEPGLWLGRLPILDAFVSAMLIAGLIFYGRHLSAARTRLLLLFTAVSAILTALSTSVRISSLVPLVYIIATAGLAYLLHIWLRVFPRNPLARGLGIGVVILLVSASCLYNLRAYYVAWPHNSETRQVFDEKLVPHR